MSLRVVALLLDVPLSTAWIAVNRLGLKPQRIGSTLCLTWDDIEQLTTYLKARRRRNATAH